MCRGRVEVAGGVCVLLLFLGGVAYVCVKWKACTLLTIYDYFVTSTHIPCKREGERGGRHLQPLSGTQTTDPHTRTAERLSCCRDEGFATHTRTEIER